MRTLTVVTPVTPALPPDLALLLAPIRIPGVVSGRDYVGHAEGVILDEEGSVLAFVVRLSPDLAPGSPRTLVSASAMTPTEDSQLLLAWSEDKLLEHPRLAEAGPPVAISTPAPDEISTGGDMDVKKTVKDGGEGAAMGAALGAL